MADKAFGIAALLHLLVVICIVGLVHPTDTWRGVVAVLLFNMFVCGIVSVVLTRSREGSP